MSVLDYGDIIYIHAPASTLKLLSSTILPLDLSLELPVPLTPVLRIAEQDAPP